MEAKKEEMNEKDKEPKTEEQAGEKKSEAEAKILELTADLQRTRADFENYRKNIEKDKENLKKITKFSTIEKILPLIDDLERAFLAYPKELKPLEKNFSKTLKNLELEKIETKSGTEFNPEVHEAVLFEEGDGEKEVILETLRPGYKYEGEVLRAAMVKVKR